MTDNRPTPKLVIPKLVITEEARTQLRAALDNADRIAQKLAEVFAPAVRDAGAVAARRLAPLRRAVREANEPGTRSRST